MTEFIITIGVLSVLAFILHGLEKNRLLCGKSQFPTVLMAIAGVIAPFGSLVGMLLFGNRLKQTLMIILVPLMLVALVLGTYLLRGEIGL